MNKQNVFKLSLTLSVGYSLFGAQPRPQPGLELMTFGTNSTSATTLTTRPSSQDKILDFDGKGIVNVRWLLTTWLFEIQLELQYSEYPCALCTSILFAIVVIKKKNI